MEKEYPLGEGLVKWSSTEWLGEHLQEGDFIIVDTQPNIHDYIQEHIPGAVYFNENLMRSSQEGRPGVWIPGDTASALFGRAGIDNRIPVLIYTGTGAFMGWGDGLSQTMLAYSLARYGHREIWLLDGGLDKWKKENRKLEKKFPARQKAEFELKLREDLYTSMEEVREAVDREDTVLLDVRPSMVYLGQGPWIKPGHIPGAVNLPWTMFMEDDNRTLLRSDGEIRKVIESRGITGEKDIICYCGTGREATNAFLLLRYYLGWENVRLYEGSFTEWSSHPDNITITGEE
jgi:thiosulfate/3-mercaptopyruvate sulfurtransferase